MFKCENIFALIVYDRNTYYCTFLQPPQNFFTKHKTSNINFFTIGEWYHFLMCVIYFQLTVIKTISN